jgi:hypothetical protein
MFVKVERERKRKRILLKYFVDIFLKTEERFPCWKSRGGTLGCDFIN